MPTRHIVIYEEVYPVSDETDETEDFATMFEASIQAKRIERGQTIDGRIVGIGDAAWPQPVPEAKRYVIRPRNLADFLEVLVKKALAVMV